MDAAGVRLVRPGNLTSGAVTPGMRREQAVDADGMWAGLVHTEPHMVSGWHHHGGYQTTIYVLTGSMRMEFGDQGAEQLVAGPGDFLHVPPFAVHREGNPTAERSTAVLFRAGQGDMVVNVDGPAG